MSTPCSMAGGRSIGSRAGALPPCAAGDCHGCPTGPGRCAIHGSATGARWTGIAAGGGGGGGTAPGTGQLTCASAAAGSVSAQSASRERRIVTLPLIVIETERLQNQPLRFDSNYSPSSGSVSRSAVGEPIFSAIFSTSSSLGG